MKVLRSTGNQQKDAQLLAEIKDSLANRLTFEEAKKRERAANAATATEPSRNALTDEPLIRGQLLAVVADNVVTEKKDVFKDTSGADNVAVEPKPEKPAEPAK